MIGEAFNFFIWVMGIFILLVAISVVRGIIESKKEKEDE